jgi:hypothetical protein
VDNDIGEKKKMKETKLEKQARKEGKRIPNVRKLPFFCFPCGRYHKELKNHDNTQKHRRNERKWRKKMGYTIWEKQRAKYDKNYPYTHKDY